MSLRVFSILFLLWKVDIALLRTVSFYNYTLPMSFLSIKKIHSVMSIMLINFCLLLYSINSRRYGGHYSLWIKMCIDWLICSCNEFNLYKHILLLFTRVNLSLLIQVNFACLCKAVIMSSSDISFSGKFQRKTEQTSS